MTPEIKHRIGQIRRGEMPEGYNRVRDSIIPSDWKQYCLGELGKNKNGLNFHREDKGIKIRILGVGDFGNLSVLRDLNALSEISMRFMPDDELLLKNGDIVFVRSNGSKELVGRNLLVYPQNEKVSFSGFCIRFRLSSDKITTAEYINLVLDNGVLKQKLQSENQGSNISNLNQSIIDNLQISIPCKGEQQKIAAILATQDKVIELKEKRLAEKQRQKKYLMQQLLTGKKRLPGFIGKWKTFGFNEIFITISTKGLQINKAEYETKGRYPVIDQGRQMIAGYSNKAEKALMCPKEGVIVFGDHTREIKFVNFDFIVGADGTQLLSAKSKNAAIKYLFYYLSNKDIHSDGYSRHFKYVKEFAYRLPPLGEQTAIAEVLSTADREIELLQQDIEQEKQKKKALMQLLLAGIVRVKT